ncbi:unnamed protein product [Thelazia callipaeda]|uniref:Coatomer subunit epsilon n=1 Tax=Thelazia callipaeda TaxID=103827 RepID=A0A0N5D391_THECL|nr:unnamed protein product [Thelazia callipaeda]
MLVCYILLEVYHFDKNKHRGGERERDKHRGGERGRELRSTENVDPLFEIRNNFLLGAYQACINEAQSLQVKDENHKLLKDVYMYRAYIGQNKLQLVLSEIDKTSQSPPLRAIRHYANYLANPSRRSSILKEFETELDEERYHDDIVSLMAAEMYIHENNIEKALRLLHPCESLETRSLVVVCLLKIDRVDLAAKEVKKMQAKDEDATITQLALSWVNMALGKDKLKDVYYTYQEMIDKYGSTPLLLVAQSSCLILQHKFEEAEKLLLGALQRDANYPEAIVNLIVVSQHLGRALEVTNRYINQLKEGSPDYKWIVDYIAQENTFDRVASEQHLEA